MNSNGLAQKLLSLLVVLLLGVGLAACGGDSDDSGSSETSATESAPSGGGPEQAIAAWFEAARLGETEKKCALESEEFQVFVYGSAGEACLKDAANTQPQPVWAEEVEIVSLDEEGESATAIIKPNEGDNKTTATINLVNQDGTWLIKSFA